MSPRQYQMGRRQEATEQTRASILAAARALGASEGPVGFTVEAVARRAGVARMTVYYQFSSKAGLLEALFDDLAQRGHMEQLAQAFTLANVFDALDAYIVTFTAFYQTDRILLRRLRALAALDADLTAVIAARDERRRSGVRVLLTRLAASGDTAVSEHLDQAVDTIFSLLSFEFCDTLAGPDRSIVDAAPLLQALVRSMIGSLASFPASTSEPASRKY